LALIKNVEVGWLVVEVLIQHGYLDRDRADDDRAIGRAISRFLAKAAGVE
jgi:hypothetical protein